MIFIMYQMLSVICFTCYLMDQLITYSDQHNLVFRSVHNGLYYFYTARQYYMDNVYPLYLNYIEPAYYTLIGNTDYFFDKRFFLIEDGSVKRSYAFLKQFEDDENNKKWNEVEGDDFDFILYRFNDQKPEIMIRFEDLTEINENFKLLSSNPFMSIMLTLGGNMHEIKLDSPENYLVEHNIVLDHLFIQWYCNRYLNVTYEDDYVIEIIDKDVTSLKLTNKEYILLEKDSYRVCNLDENGDDKNGDDKNDENNDNDNDNDNDNSVTKDGYEGAIEENVESERVEENYEDYDTNTLIHLATTMIQWKPFYSFSTETKSD